MTTTLTRCYRFSASHRLHVPSLAPEENRRLFGKCNNPFGHGHNYVLEVTAEGVVNEATGLLLPVQKLDRLVTEEVLHLLEHRSINQDVPQFERRIPTTENLALVVSALIERHWNEYLGGVNAHLRRVHIQETARNEFDVLLPRKTKSNAQPAKEEILLGTDNYA